MGPFLSPARAAERDLSLCRADARRWIPAFAGMTMEGTAGGKLGWGFSCMGILLSSHFFDGDYEDAGGACGLEFFYGFPEDGFFAGGVDGYHVSSV